MNTTLRQSKLYSFCKAFVAVLCFAVCFYLFLVCFTATFRLIIDVGYKRVLFLNPLLILLVAFAAVLAGGVFLLRSEKAVNCISRLDDEQIFRRTKKILMTAIFVECLVFAVVAFGMQQRVDQYSVQYSAYGLSWDVTEVLTPPRHLGVYPNNVGFVFVLYLLSLVAGHYNNAAVMLILSLLVPFIYSDLADIGERFGMSKRSQILIMICGLLFLPLQSRVTYVYGDIPGLFFAVRAMKQASVIATGKSSAKNVAAVIAFTSLAYVFKNNFIIFAIAILLYLTVELLRQRRFKELLIPLAVIVSPFLMFSGIKLIIGAVSGNAMSSGASMFSWIAMGMQEDAGAFNGYNDATYAEAGFDAGVQAEIAKQEIADRLNFFLANPNQAVGFYIRKIMLQWSDPTYLEFDFISRNVYLTDNASPLAWFISDPGVIMVAASFLKVFQVLMLAGGCIASVKAVKSKTGNPVMLLITTFVGGFFFHILWESGPAYAMPYMVILIPVGVSGLISLIKGIASLKKGQLSNIKIEKSASGIACFIAGTIVFLLAAAGIGTIRQLLADGRNEYRIYFNETLPRVREPIQEGTYYLKPAFEGYEGEGLKIELVRYAGKYRMKMVSDGSSDEIYLTNAGGTIKADWFSYDGSQVFVIIRNLDGTYLICQGDTGAMSADPEKGMFMDEFIGYTFQFNKPRYEEYVSEHPALTWNFIPAS